MCSHYILENQIKNLLSIRNVCFSGMPSVAGAREADI